MRCLLPALGVSLLIWVGIAEGVIAVTHRLAPNVLPSAKHELHQAATAARRPVLAQAF